MENIEEGRNGIKRNTIFILPILILLLIMTPKCLSKNSGEEHTLTYTMNHLEWDKNTKTSKEGVAELSLFNGSYNNVQSDEGNVVAPGTSNDNTIKIKNKEKGDVDFTVIIYRIEDHLPIKVNISNNDFNDTNSYSIPSNIKKADIIKTIKGNVKGNEEKKFNINWSWAFEESEEQNQMDTFLGDKSAEQDPDYIKIGLYVVAEDNNDYSKYSSNIPMFDNNNPAIAQIFKTENKLYLGCIILLCTSAIILIIYFIKKRNKITKGKTTRKE